MTEPGLETYKIRCAGCGKWVLVIEEGVDTLCGECFKQLSEQPQSFDELKERNNEY